MRRNLLLAYQADRQYLKFRWLILLFAAFMSFSSDKPISPVTLGAVLAVASLLGIGAHRAIRTLEAYKSRGHIYPGLLRLLDLASICLASSTSPQQFGNLWLIAIPIVLIECLSTAKAMRSVIFTLAAIILVSYHGISSGDLGSCIVPATSMLATGCKPRCRRSVQR